ncbi:MAG: signal peptidase II [Ghiorsea sp.]|nr:signal peptidase II [Ghiorsea sp.]
MIIRTKQQMLVFILLLTADQLSKWWIEQQYPFFHMTVIEGFFNLVKAHNYGVAFSMFADWNHAWRTNLLLGVTIAIAVTVGVWWWRERHKPGIESWLLLLILVGAAGNILDRLYLGYVVDFIDWYVVWDGKAYHWPAFNIADACISVSVVLLLLRSFRKG